MIDDFEFKKRNDKFNIDLQNLQNQLQNLKSDSMEAEKLQQKLNTIENCLSSKLDIRENLPYLVNLLIDKVIVEKVNNDRKHIRLAIYFDFNTPEVALELDMNQKDCLKVLAMQNLAYKKRQNSQKCSHVDTHQPGVC